MLRMNSSLIKMGCMAEITETDIHLEQLEWMFFSTLRRINQHMDSHSRELEKQYGLTLPQLDVLWAVAQEDGLPIGRIAEKVHLSKATVTHITDRLVDHDLLIRERSTIDKRQVHVRITDRATAILRQGPHPFHELFLERIAQLEHWKQSQLLSSLQRIASLMEPDRAKQSSLPDSAV